MHVLYVVGQNSGGLPHYTAELANAVSEECEVTVMKPSETTADGLFGERVRTVNAFSPMDVSMQNVYDLELNLRKNLRGLLSYRNLRRVNEIDPDIVHDPTDRFPQVKLFSSLYRLGESFPYVVTLHELEHGGESPITGPKVVDFLESLIPSFEAERLVVHTERQKRTLVERGTPSEKVRVIPHGVYDVFKDHEGRLPEREPNTVLFFGSIVPPKGLDTLVEAIPRLAESVPDVTAIVAGKGNISSRSRRIIRNHPEHFEVHNSFVPNDEVGALFARAQVVALPYRSGWLTGHSGVLSIAYSFSRPVVATNVGPFPETVEEPGCGLTVPPEDSEALARALAQVLQDDELRARLERNSRKRADELSWRSIGREYVALYRNVLESRRAAHPAVG